jgi:hypothetical protein
MRLEVNAYFAMLLLLASMLEGLKGFASAQPIESLVAVKWSIKATVPFATALKRTATAL